MSMINDALRRASSASRAPTGGAPPPVAVAVAVPPPPPPMPMPVSAFAAPPPAPPEELLPPEPEAESEAAPKSTKVQIALAVLLVVAVGVAAFLNYWEKKKRSERVDVSDKQGRKAINYSASADRTRAVTSNTAFAAAVKAASNSAPTATATSHTAVATAVAAAVVAPPPPPKFPALRLQSIFYRPASPSVMINGKTLFVDDQIQGVTIADIQPANVTLVLSGFTNVLTLR